MTTSLHIGHSTTILLAVIAAAVACAPANAIPMEVTAGFDGAMKGFVWTPITVELTNDSDTDLEGEIRVLQQDVDQPYLARCTARASVPAHSKKLYHSYVRLPGYGGDLEVLFARGGSVYAFRKVPVRTGQRTDTVVVSVGGRASRLNYLNGDSIPLTGRYNPRNSYNSGSAGGQSAIQVGSISPKLLPDRPMAYDGVDLLILSGLTPTSTNAKALRAVAMWVASGGTLVIPTGPDFRVYQNEFYDDLLPVTITGAANLAGLGSLEALGRMVFPASPVSVSKAAIKPGIGRVIASESGVPIVVERDYGAGKVIYLAFDHLASPFKDWGGQATFWKSILASPPVQPLARGVMSEFDESTLQGGYGRWQQDPYWITNGGYAAALVMQNPAVRAPSFNSIGLFLIAYLVMLAPVNYFVLKRRRRLELAWVTTPVIVLAFTVGAYAIGYTMKGSDLRLREVTVIEATSDSRCASAVTDASLFSPARRSYDLAANDPFALAQAIPMRDNDRLPAGFIDEKADRCTIERADMAMWSSKTFESAGGVDLGGVVASGLVLNGQHLSGTIRNDTRIPLTHCVICYGGRQVKIADLPRGGSARVDMTVAPSQAASPLGSVPAGAKADLQISLENHALSTALQAGSPVLVARAESRPPVFTLTRQRPSRTSAACCLVRLGYSAAGTFAVDPRAVRVKILKSVGANVQPTSTRSGLAQFEMWGGGEVQIAFSTTIPASTAVTSLVLTNSSTAPPTGHLDISIMNKQTSKWDPVASAGGVALDPSRYLDAGNVVRVRVRCHGGGSMRVALGIRFQGANK